MKQVGFTVWEGARRVLWLVFFVIAFVVVCLVVSMLAGHTGFREPSGVYTVYTGGRLIGSH